MLDKGIDPMLNKLLSSGNLKIFYNTVPKRAHLQIENSKSASNFRSIRKTTIPSSNGEPTTIISLDAIQRIPKIGTRDARLLGEALPDWYTTNEEQPSSFYDKKLINFNGTANRPIPIFVEGTEWGELLAMTTENYLQGISEQYDGDISRTGFFS